MKAPWHRERVEDPWDWSSAGGCVIDALLGVLLVAFAFVLWYLIHNAA